MPVNAQGFWDRVSRLSRPVESLEPKSARLVEASTAFLSAQDVVLDLGCGSGALSLAIAGHVASLLAIDTSPGMLAQAQAHARRRGVQNLSFAAGGLADQRARRGAFTAVTAFNVLPYVDDLGQAAQQIEQLLAPGGVFISSTACLADRFSLPRLFVKTLTTLRLMPPTHFFKQTELQASIEAAGLRIVEIRQLSALPECFIVARKAA